VSSVRRYAGEYAAHRHDHAQVLLGLDGTLELELEGRGARIDASSGLIVPAGVDHAYLAAHPARVLVIDCAPGAALERARHFRMPPEWRGRTNLDAAGALVRLGTLGRRHARRRLDLCQLDATLDAELHVPWSAARMAAVVHLSVPRFHARFVELTGTTPAAYLRDKRLNAATRLIATHGFSLKAAAAQVGYGGASALAYALRRERGLGARLLRDATHGANR
jgi:AraC-like DNA-binding protein